MHNQLKNTSSQNYIVLSPWLYSMTQYRIILVRGYKWYFNQRNVSVLKGHGKVIIGLTAQWSLLTTGCCSVDTLSTLLRKRLVFIVFIGKWLTENAYVCLFVWLVGFLTSSSTTRLYRGRERLCLLNTAYNCRQDLYTELQSNN